MVGPSSTASNSPRLRPVAVNGTRAVSVANSKRLRLPAGSGSSAYGGIVNVPAFAATVQRTAAPLVWVLSVTASIAIRTTAFGEPPVQVRVIPLERVTG